MADIEKCEAYHHKAKGASASDETNVVYNVEGDEIVCWLGSSSASPLLPPNQSYQSVIPKQSSFGSHYLSVIPWQSYLVSLP